MEIDNQLQQISPDDIELMDWLPVKFAPKDTAGRSAKFVPTLEMGAALSALFPQPTVSKGEVCVLRYPDGIQKSGAPYGLVSGYRPWQGAVKRRLQSVSSKVIHATLEEYEDQGFRAWLCLIATQPRLNAMLSQTLQKSERTAYRHNSIAERLDDQLSNIPLSQAAMLALIQAPVDEQSAVLDDLARTQRRLTAENIRTAISIRAGGSSLPDLKPLRDAAKLCRQLTQRSDWSANDLTLIKAIILNHIMTLKTLFINLRTRQVGTTRRSGPSPRVASPGTTPQCPTKGVAGPDATL